MVLGIAVLGRRSQSDAPTDSECQPQGIRRKQMQVKSQAYQPGDLGHLHRARPPGAPNDRKRPPERQWAAAGDPQHRSRSSGGRRRLSQESENVATEALAFILQSSKAAQGGMAKLLRSVLPDLPKGNRRRSLVRWGSPHQNTPGTSASADQGSSAGRSRIASTPGFPRPWPCRFGRQSPWRGGV